MRWSQWHGAIGRTEFADPRLAQGRFLSPILFVDGHSAVHNFTQALSKDPCYPYEPTKDWIWYKPAEGSSEAIVFDPTDIACPR